MKRQDAFGAYSERSRVQRSATLEPDGVLPDWWVAEVIGNVARRMAEQHLTYADIAAAIGAESSDVIATMSGHETLAALRDRLLRDLNKWTAEGVERAELAEDVRVVMTCVIQSILSLARAVKATRDVGLAFGGSGIGKTLGSRIVSEELVGTLFVTVTRCSRSPAKLVRAIDAAMRRSRRTRLVAFEDVVERLKGTGRLVIVDQAHRATMPALEALMDLHDAAELPILLVGTVDVHKRLADDTDPHFGQLSSRVGPRLDLTGALGTLDGEKVRKLVSVADLRKMFAGNKLKLHPDAAKMLADEANGSVGHLRRAIRLYRWATFAARGDKSDTIMAAHVEQALIWVEGQARQRPIVCEAATTAAG